MSVPIPKAELQKYYQGYKSTTTIVGTKNNEKYTLDITELSSAKLVEKAARGIKGVSFENPPHALWFLLYHNSLLVGSVCCVIKGQSARFKSDFLLDRARGQGLYAAMSKVRLDYAYHANCAQVTCYSTLFSRGQFLRDKFVQESERNGIAYMRRVL